MVISIDQNLPSGTPDVQVALNDMDGWLHVQVLTASALRISDDMSDLRGDKGGLEISQADGVKSLRWIGPVIVRGRTDGCVATIVQVDCLSSTSAV